VVISGPVVIWGSVDLWGSVATGEPPPCPQSAAYQHAGDRRCLAGCL